MHAFNLSAPVFKELIYERSPFKFLHYHTRKMQYFCHLNHHKNEHSTLGVIFGNTYRNTLTFDAVHDSEGRAQVREPLGAELHRLFAE